jgi:predicted dehydrogenase
MPQSDHYKSESLPWRVIPEMAGGGYFFDLASHTFDLLDYYFGPITSAYGKVDNQMKLYPAEDIVSASFDFENGVIGSGLWCFTSTVKEDSLEIIGQQGKISLSTFSQDPIFVEIDKKRESIQIDHPEHIQQPHIQSIIDEILGKGKCPSHGNDAARTSWVMDQIIQDWRTSKAIKFD